MTPNRIQFIDGAPIEKTQVKQLWLVMFVGAAPSDSRARLLFYLHRSQWLKSSFKMSDK